jgi:histidinol-phosphatase (PHP family)
MKFDYHIHTKLSDGANSHKKMTRTAVKKGFDEIGFSDHFCINHDCKWAVNSDGIHLLQKSVEEMKKMFGDKIEILFGLEVDYFPGKEKEIREALEPFSFDYVMGSIHFLDDWNYDTDRSRYDQYDNDFVYNWYFKELQKAASSGLFDVMAHPDLIKKFQIWPNSSQQELYRETAKVFADAGVAYEVNTSGVDRPCGEFFPGKEFMKALFDAGVPVTMGSDSHNSKQIGRYFDEAVILLKNIGYKNLVRFSRRNKIFVKIE